MPTIPVDNEVFEYLEKKVRGFNDSPNSVLRREFKLPEISPGIERANGHLPRKIAIHGKRQKASLRQLVEIGSLREGQSLHMRDYQGKAISGAEATVEGDRLRQNGRIDSMSSLAAKHLKKAGYQGSSVRGPSFWFTSKGRSVTELWDEYLAAGVK